MLLRYQCQIAGQTGYPALTIFFDPLFFNRIVLVKKTFQLGLLDTFLIMDIISLYRDIGI